MTEPQTAVVAGHICLDVIPKFPAMTLDTFEKSFTPGRLIEVGPVTFSNGGPVSNTGLALHKLGIQARLMGKVGRDQFGQAIRQTVTAYGPELAEGLVVDDSAGTSYTIVINPPGLDRIFLHSPGANDTFRADDVRYEQVAQASLFHFGYPPIMKLMYQDKGKELAETFRRARETGVTTSLDMALPHPTSAAGQADWISILQATLPYVDIFLPSGEEILYMLRRNTYQELDRAAGGGDMLAQFTPELLSSLGQELLALGVKVAVIKLGHRGIYIRTAGQAAIEAMGRARPVQPAAWTDRELWAPALKVNEVGATGSGDSAIAGFLAAFLRGLPVEETLVAATAVGACNVEAADSLSGIRSWNETLARLAEGWERHKLALAAPGWRFDEAQQLWLGPGSR